MAQKAEIKGKINLDSSGFKRGIAQSKKSVGNFVSSLKGSLLPALGAVGAAGALANFGRKAIESASQITELARVSGVGVVEFQKLAEAAKTVNIGQEKLADIFKDTSDKMGDFLQSGGGAMVDFFENIAPLVGATKEEFVGLSGKDSLQRYVDYLEQANIPHADMIFYMEAIASDASMLIPLLEDGGKAFRELGDGAEEAGRLMDEATIKALKRAENNIERFKQNVTVFVGDIIAALAPAPGAFDELAEAQLKAEGALMDATVAHQYESMADFLLEMKKTNGDLIKQRAEILELEALSAKLNTETIAKVDEVARLTEKDRLDAIEALAKEKDKTDRKDAKDARDLARQNREDDKLARDADRAEKEEADAAAAKRISDFKLKLLKAEAAEDSEATNEARKQLELEQRTQDIIESTNVTREEAVQLAKNLQAAESGADTNQSGYVTPREQRAADRKKRTEEREQRKREAAERASEVGAGERERKKDRYARMTERERASGLYNTTLGRDGAEMDGLKASEKETQAQDPQKEMADTLKSIDETLKENPE